MSWKKNVDSANMDGRTAYNVMYIFIKTLAVHKMSNLLIKFNNAFAFCEFFYRILV